MKKPRWARLFLSSGPAGSSAAFEMPLRNP
jgi:hypothetical protein